MSAFVPISLKGEALIKGSELGGACEKLPVDAIFGWSGLEKGSWGVMLLEIGGGGRVPNWLKGGE